ncbi:unnamed protein product, partial [marine sediment metagenome]
AIGTDILGNYPASGTVIIAELGEEHMKTGYPVVYTSADSVFQVAAHEAIIPPPRLYEMCRIARNILKGPHSVGRVIARPFIGEPGCFTRTSKRRDYNLKPAGPTLLDALKESGHSVTAIGKIEDIFAGQGITQAVHTRDNQEGVEVTLDIIKSGTGRTVGNQLIFTNLVDFDMLYGHRNDVEGYKAALEYFDSRLPELLGNMDKEDLLVIIADHGCDPTTPGTDHSREYVPLILYGSCIGRGVNLGTRSTFSDLGLSLADIYGLKCSFPGSSFADQIISRS